MKAGLLRTQFSYQNTVVREKMKEKTKESVSAVVPIMLIVLLLGFTIAPLSPSILVEFIVGAVLVIIGMVFFSLGAELSMTPMGERVGGSMLRTKKLWMIIAIGFILGVIITISELDLQVLAGQVAAVPNMVLILSVAVGVGVFLVATRVFVAGKMEKREADVMDALDLIIPEIGSGVKNAIARYVDNFSPSLQQDFKIFLSNIQDRGMSFEDAMFILADSLGNIFKDFAQKAVFYEALGEEDMRGIFDDIVETNRQRRELRYNNNLEFGVLRLSFIISAGITIGYFIFLMATDWFSRYFFLTTTWGNILLVAIVLTIFGVLSYIATIKSRAI